MDMTKKQSKALSLAFDSGIVKNMEVDEYLVYIQYLLSLSLATMIENKGHNFTAEFVEAGLNETGPLVFAKQVKSH